MSEPEREPAASGLPGSSSAVERNFLILTGLYTLSASLIWGVNTLFLLDAGLSVFQVFVANSVFTASMAIFEIPTGVLADTRGRRLSFLLSLLILLLGTLGYVWAAQVGGGVFLFSVMSVVMGLGFTFYSGAMEAWVVDALDATGFEGTLDQVFARSGMVTGAAMLVGTIGGGFLATVDMAIPYLVRSILLAVVFAFAYFVMFDIGFEPRATTRKEMPAEMQRIALAGIAYGWNVKPVRLLILASLVQNAVVNWGFYAWQPYFLELLGAEAIWISGVIAALIALSMMAGNSIVGFTARFCGKRTTILLWAAAIQTAAILVVGLATTFWVAVGFYLVSAVAFGMIGPVHQAFLHQLIPSEERATVVSFDSLMRSAGSVVSQTGLGYMSQVRSFGTAYVTSGLFLGLMLPIFYRLRRRDDPADLMLGDASHQSACAVQGLPAVSGVESLTVAGDSGALVAAD